MAGEICENRCYPGIMAFFDLNFWKQMQEE